MDGEWILEGFEPARPTDPMELPAGEHEVAFREADAAPDSEPVVQGAVDLPGRRPVSRRRPGRGGQPDHLGLRQRVRAAGRRPCARWSAHGGRTDDRRQDPCTVIVRGLASGEEGSTTVPHLPVRRLFTRNGAAVLTLITCGGRFDAATRHHDASAVVQAPPR